MSKIGLLLKIHFMGYFGINKAIHTRDRGYRSKTLALVVFVSFGMLALYGSYCAYCYVMGLAAKQLGAFEMLPALMMGLTSILCLFTTIYKGSAILFQSSDHNIILPLPIKAGHMVIAKLLILYLTNLSFAVLVMAPPTVIYGMMTAPPVLYYLYAMICVLMIPVLPILAGTVFSVVISLVASRFRFKNLVNILLTLLLCGGIVFGSTTLSSHAEDFTLEQLGNLSGIIQQSLYRLYPLTETFVKAVCQQDILALILFVVIGAAAFALFAIVVGSQFGKMHTLLTTSTARGNYRMESMTVNKPLKALYLKELKRYFACPIYVVNTMMGVVMLLIGAVVLLLQSDTLKTAAAAIPFLDGRLPALAPFLMCCLVGMTNTTAVSISLEGKTFPLLKSLPVSPMQIFRAKILVNLTVTLPAILITAPIFGIALDMNGLELLFCFLIPAGFTLLCSVGGIIINLLFPSFDWSSEVTVVKQSMGCVIGIFGGMLIPVIPLGIVFLVNQSWMTLTLAVIVVAFAAAVFGLDRLLKGWGCRGFQKL